MFCTYILYSESADKYYVGSTNDINSRLKKHNNKNKGYTNRSSDWKIVYKKDFVNRTDAIMFEKEIKSWKSRTMIQKLISADI